MKTLQRYPVRPCTVKLIGKLLTPLVDGGVMSQPEYNEVMVNLRSLAAKGEMLPVVLPKLIDQKAAAEILGISFPHFRKLEAQNVFSFKRRMLGTAVRYRNTDVLDYILSIPESET